MKIVFVSKECPPSPRSSGIGTYVWETGRALAEMGHTITIVAAADDGQLSSSVPVPNLTVIRLPDDEIDIGKRNIVARTLKGPVREGIAYRRRVADCLEQLAAEKRMDIVEFCGFRGESYVWLERGVRLPMVVRMHGFTAGIDTGWKKRLSASGRCLHTWELREVLAADLITAVSENQAGPVRARFGAERVRVIHNSIDTGWWRELAAEAESELQSNDILYAGGLSKKKGVFVLLEAASVLREGGWQGQLVLAGRAYRDFDRYVKLRGGAKSLPSWVTVLGTCSRERLAGLYRDAGVCCFPSLQDPLPYTCMEAMTCGGVVVGTSETGIAEMLTPQTGFVTSRGDVASLAKGISNALALSVTERAEMKAAAQQRTRENFDHQVILPRLISMYEEVIALFYARSNSAQNKGVQNTSAQNA